MTSYATRQGRRAYGYGVSKARDGDGAFGTTVSIKAGTLTSSTIHRSDIERAGNAPMPSSPAWRLDRYNRSDTAMSDDSSLFFGTGTGNVQYADDRESVHMRQLQPRPSEQDLEANDRDKSMQILGIGGTGHSTEVTGGNASTLPGGVARSKTNASSGGIEVERSVLVTTTHVDKNRF